MKTLLLLLLASGFAGSLCADDTNYFVVGRLPEYGPATNSFLIPVTQVKDIFKCRLLVATDGTFYDLESRIGERAPFLTIRPGSDGMNRNFADPSQPLWSWHVKELSGWSLGFISTRYRHPWDLERAVADGVVTNDVLVGFSAFYYTVTAELNPSFSLYLYKSPEWENGLFLYWTHHDTNLTYSVEWTASLARPAWRRLVPGTQRVEEFARAVLYVRDDEIGGGGFFRLRAERPAPAP